MNKYVDTSKYEEKILDVILPLEKITKDTKGDASPVQLRHGRLDDDSIYKNRKVINTRYGNTLISSRVKMYFRAFTNDDSILTIDIYNTDDGNLFKKFVIKSLNNNYSLTEMKNLCDEIKETVTEKKEIISLIEKIRNKENLKYEEIVQ